MARSTVTLPPGQLSGTLDLKPLPSRNTLTTEAACPAPRVPNISVAWPGPSVAVKRMTFGPSGASDWTVATTW